jgi:hypothetical protein
VRVVISIIQEVFFWGVLRFLAEIEYIGLQTKAGSASFSRRVFRSEPFRTIEFDECCSSLFKERVSKAALLLWLQYGYWLESIRVKALTPEGMCFIE